MIWVNYPKNQPSTSFEGSVKCNRFQGMVSEGVGRHHRLDDPRLHIWKTREGYDRIILTHPVTLLEEAMERLKEFVKTWPKHGHDLRITPNL